MYVEADLLDVRAGGGLFHSLMGSCLVKQQEQFARLLQCMSALPEGVSVCTFVLVKQVN